MTGARKRHDSAASSAAATQQLRDFTSWLRTEHGDDLGPMFYRDVQRLCDDYEKLRRAAEQLLDYVPTKGATIRAGYGNARANLKGLLDGSL